MFPWIFIDDLLLVNYMYLVFVIFKYSHVISNLYDTLNMWSQCDVWQRKLSWGKVHDCMAVYRVNDKVEMLVDNWNIGLCMLYINAKLRSCCWNLPHRPDHIKWRLLVYIWSISMCLYVCVDMSLIVYTLICCFHDISPKPFGWQDMSNATFCRIWLFI